MHATRVHSILHDIVKMDIGVVVLTQMRSVFIAIETEGACRALL